MNAILTYSTNVLVHIYTKARSFGCLMPMRCVGKRNLRQNVSFLLFRSMTYFYKRQLQITFRRQLKVRSSKIYNCLISLMATSGNTTGKIWYSLLTNKVDVAPGGIGNFISVDIVLWHINSPRIQQFFCYFMPDFVNLWGFFTIYGLWVYVIFPDKPTQTVTKVFQLQIICITPVLTSSSTSADIHKLNF